MIKFFQKLKAKKGFTLVELIVVIAIIGVLAAILVPTMLGYVTSSRVTSANSTASSIKNQIDSFLTSADTAGYGMKLSPDATATLKITVANGEWTVVVDAGTSFGEGTSSNSDGVNAFKNKAGVGEWKSSATAKKDDTKSGANGDATKILAVSLKELFPDITSATMRVYLQGGKAMYCWYTTDSVTANAATPSLTNFQAGSCPWDGNTAGVTSDGYTIGTAPALAIGEGTITKA